MSVVDQLTGIANRRAFEERFAALAARCSDECVLLGLSMIDIDHFKRLEERRKIKEVLAKFCRSVRAENAYAH